MTHVCKLGTIGSDHDSSPVRLQTIIWTIVRPRLIGHIRKLHEIWIWCYNWHSRKWVWKFRLKWRRFCFNMIKNSRGVLRFRIFYYDSISGWICWAHVFLLMIEPCLDSHMWNIKYLIEKVFCDVWYLMCTHALHDRIRYIVKCLCDASICLSSDTSNI